MGSDPQPEERKGLEGANSDLERRFPIALGLYVVLGLLAWFTIGEGKVFVFGWPVEIRLVPLVVLAGMAVRTVLARQAERIRRQSGDGNGSSGL
jgi:hypothetical protein